MFQKFQTFRNHVFEFRPNLTLNELSSDIMTDFIASEHARGLYNTSIDKDIRYFRWFLRWAANNGFYSGRLHETFRPRLKGTDGANRDVIHLTWDELQLLNSFDLTTAGNVGENGETEVLGDEQKKALERVRDVFCFCCFTGLRYSDVARLTKFDVRDDFILIVDDLKAREMDKFNQLVPGVKKGD